jgi:hypothetical protein
MEIIANKERAYWLAGGAAGIVLAYALDAAVFDATVRFAFAWAVEPFSRLVYLGAFCA